jgi:hypothetical protein
MNMRRLLITSTLPYANGPTRTTYRPFAALAIAFFLASSDLAQGTEKTEAVRRIALSGKVAELVGQHRACLFNGAGPIFFGNVKDFPITLPVAKLILPPPNKSGKLGAVFMEFKDPTDTRTLSIVVGGPLFASHKDVTIRLDRPALATTVGPTYNGLHMRVTHCAQPEKDVWYRDLPNWNRESKHLTRAKEPLIEIRLSDQPNRVLLNKRMQSDKLCHSDGWSTIFDIPPDVQNGRTLIITVTHDTGDLWGKISNTKNYVVER